MGRPGNLGSAARVLAIVPAIGLLVGLGAYAVESGTTSATLTKVTLETGVWRAPRSQQTATVSWSRDELMAAAQRSPADPNVHELLGLLGARGFDVSDAANRTSPEILRDASAQYREALMLRASSPYTWANFAALQYRLGNTGPKFEAALVRAAQTGPYEPEVQAIVANFGLAVWNEVAAPTRAAIEQAVASGMKRNPREFLQIGERRGRLGVPCRHLPGAPSQADPKWSQLCQSMEAIS
jgi:hypothetical protein